MGWVVADNKATNPTQVNGDPIDRHLLEDGDIITIGTTMLTYQAGKSDLPYASADPLINPPSAEPPLILPMDFASGGTDGSQPKGEVLL
jgi:pSer/pThr/pTyr-binding forkhead associated (FHA) protein